MKKFATVILCGAMALSLAGCGAGPAEAPTTTTTTETSEAPTTTAAPDNSGDEFVSDYAAFAVTTNSLTDKGFWEEITANTVDGQNLSPDLQWDPVEGASCYAIYMVDLNTHYFLHWVQGDITDTSLPQGYAGTKFYMGMYPPPGDTHVYNIYVFALKNPVTKVKGTANTISAKLPDFMKELDTDKDGNTGNIIAVGKVSGKFTGK